MSEQEPIRHPGEELRRAREAQGRTARSVAASLNLSAAVIEALEEGDDSKLPPSTFVRGYLRGYARLVGLDADEVIAAYNRIQDGVELPDPDKEAHEQEDRAAAVRQDEVDEQRRRAVADADHAQEGEAANQHAGHSAPSGGDAGYREGAGWEHELKARLDQHGSSSTYQSSRYGNAAPERQGYSPRTVASRRVAGASSASRRGARQRSAWLWGLSGGVVVLLLAGGMALWRYADEQERQPEAATEQAEEQAEKGEKGEKAPAEETETTAARRSEPSPPVPPVAPGLDLGTPVPQLAARIEEFKAAEAEQQPGLVVKVAAQAEAWLEVHADGEREVFRLVEGPATLELEQAEEYRLVIGNADAVQVEHFGEPFDLSPFIRQDVARVTLSRE